MFKTLPLRYIVDISGIYRSRTESDDPIFLLFKRPHQLSRGIGQTVEETRRYHSIEEIDHNS
jgi:hypothetical protein